MIDPRRGHRQANQPAPVGRHEVDRRGIGKLRRDYQIAFILAVLMVHQNEHTALARVFDDVLDRRDRIAQPCLDRSGFVKLHRLLSIYLLPGS